MPARLPECLPGAKGGAAALCLVLAAAAGAADFSAWSHRQEVRVPAAGLVKLPLPPDTLDASRPTIEDLRLTDPAGNEVPYALERPAPAAGRVREARSFVASLGPSATVLTVETGLTRPLDGVTLRTPAPSFVKAVHVEGSRDRQAWRTLGRGLPIFRQPSGASQLRLTFPAGAWPFLRLTVDDRRSLPVPFTGAQVHAAADAGPTEPVDAGIVDRTESAGVTRLTLDLGAARLHLAALEVESPDPLFTRRLSLVARHVEANVIVERTLATGWAARPKPHVTT